MRKRVEEIFGWLKTVGMTRKVRYRGMPRVDWNFTFALAAYNLVRIATSLRRQHERTIERLPDTATLLPFVLVPEQVASSNT
jgi:hypothetical protein